MKAPKCKCGPKDTESFCQVCCPEEYECLEWPHIQKHIEKRLIEVRPTKYQIGDKVWVLGNRKVEQKEVYGVCLEQDYKNGKNVTVTRYELELNHRSSSSSRFFYTDELLFTTRQALLDSLCS